RWPCRRASRGSRAARQPRPTAGSFLSSSCFDTPCWDPVRIPARVRTQQEREAVLQGFYVTTHELERLFAGRDRPRGALLGDEVEEAADLRAGRHAQLVAAEERLPRLGRPRPLEGRRELERVQEREGVGGPRLGHPAEAVERAR